MIKKLILTILGFGPIGLFAQNLNQPQIDTHTEESYEDGTLVNKTYTKTTEFFENGKVKSIKNCLKGTSDCNYIIYYENGQISEQYREIDNKVEGEYLSYYKSGALEDRSFYENDLLQGQSIVYYENGQIQEISNFKDDLYHGPSQAFYEDGRLKANASYAMDELHGPFTTYFPNGQLEEKGTYKAIFDEDGAYDESLYIGAYENYLEDGRLVSKGEYSIDEDGYQFLKGYWDLREYFDKDESGRQQLKATGQMIDEKFHGEVIQYFSDGSVEKKGRFEMGKKQGEHLEYSDNGNLYEKITYVNGEHNGPYALYHYNGKPREKGVAKPALSDWGDFQKEGPWVEWDYYDYDGQVKESITTVDGERHGTYTKYNEDGSIREKGEYKNGEYEGEWYIYYPEKGKQFKLYYSNGEALYSNSVTSIYDKLADPHYKLHFKNKCHKTIEVALRIRNLDGQWVSKGWYTVEPGESSYLVDTDNRIYYFYANSITGNYEWSGNENKTIRGKTYPFKKKTMPESTSYGKYTQSLSCNK